MNDFDFDQDLAQVATAVQRLSREVRIDPQHRVRLHAELMQHHRRMMASPPRARTSWLAPFTHLSRLAVVTPLALGGAVAASVLLWGLAVTGQQRAHPAQAEKLSAAMVRTVPTVTGWQWGVTRHGANSTRFTGYTNPNPGRVYVYRYSGKLVPYLRVNGEWKGVPTETSGSVSTTDWLWAFAQLPVRLAEHRAKILDRTRVVDGTSAVGVAYMLTAGRSITVRAIAWVNPTSGRILLLERQVLRGHRLVEADWAHYVYQRSR
jgi:hypothetical protein